MIQGRVSRPEALLAPVVLTLVLLGVALLRGFSAYAPGDLAVLVGIYLALATALHAGSLCLARLAAPLGLLGSLAVGAVAIWQVREMGLAWLSPLALIGAAAAAGLVHFAWLLRLRRGGSAWAAAGVACVGALLFVGLGSAAFQLSNTLRWHLLNQHRMLGTPAYYLLSRPAAELRDAVWEGRATRPPPPPAPERVADDGRGPGPHIVFVLVDTLRADALRVYGAERELMPNLDAIAARSLVFRDVLANASWTRPSVASFFTGLLPEEHGAVGRSDRLAEGWSLLAERLRARGYATAAFVSNYGAVGREAGFAQGFDAFEQLPGGIFPYARAERVNAATASWLRHHLWRGSGDPVFLYLHYLDPHSPYLVDPQPATVAPLDVDKAREGYDAELRYLDGWLGKIFAHLEERLPAPWYVFLSSDHGEEFGEHGKSGHGRTLYAEVVRLPALLLGSEGRAGVVDARLEARDFFDLIQRLAREPQIDVAQWAATRSRSRRYLSTYSETPASFHRPYNRSVGLRGLESDGLYLIWSAYGDTWELYDHRADPDETRNLAGERPERTRQLAAEMDESMEWWVDRQPVDHSAETLQMLKELGYIEE